MRRLKSLMALVGLLAFVGAAAAQEAATEAPALPDYTTAPFVQIGTDTQTVQGHESWGECTVTLYATSKEKKAGAQAVYVITDKDGNKKLADWLAVNDEATDWAFRRRYLYVDGAWKFEKDLR